MSEVYVKLDVLTVATRVISLSWDVTSYNLVEAHPRVGTRHCLHLLVTWSTY
jgi:hypothetical protein